MRIVVVLTFSALLALAQSGVSGPPRVMMRFVMEDGTEVPKEFSVLRFGACDIDSVFGNGTVLFRMETQYSTQPQNVPACSLRVSAPGIREWRGIVKDGAQVVMKRLGEHEGSMISYTVLKAPTDARKAYAKGAQEILKKKYESAQKFFEEAVKAYPQYSLAWSELGRARQSVGNIEGARAAFKESIRTDENYLKPRVQLAALEATEKNWAECARVSDEALALSAVEFPGAYYYRGLAHVEAAEWRQAAKRFLKSVEFDADREYPRAYILLAKSMEALGDKSGASRVLNNFLTTKPPEEAASEAKDALKRLSN